MFRSNKMTLLLMGAIFIGVLAGLIIASNFNIMLDGYASDINTEKEKVVLGSSAPPLQNSIDVEQLDNAFVKVAEDVKPSVVTISSAKIIKYRHRNPYSLFDDDFFRRFFGTPDNRRDNNRDEDREEEFRQEGLGSGVIVSSDGYILTNNHVIKDADEIKVVTIDDKEYTAEVIGKDDKTDVAVIKIEAKNLPAARLGNSEKVKVGQWVLAIGNPFAAALEHTVTHGIVSAKGRSEFQLAQYEDFIQTDAAINPGNSGGALVNLYGQVIGINTAIISRSGGNVGIGFAIPINMAQHIMEMLIDKGRVVRGYLGLYGQDVDEELAKAMNLKKTKGALVSQVQKGEPADLAGLKSGDVIIKMENMEIEDYTDLRLKVASLEPNRDIELIIIRDGKEKKLTVTLGERPPDDQTASNEKPKTNDKLGIQVENLTAQTARQYGHEDDEGVLVARVKRTSILYRKGLRPGDLIKEIKNEKIESVSDFNKVMNSIKPNEIVVMRIKKEGNFHQFISFTMPEDK